MAEDNKAANVVEVPKDFKEAILEHAHQAVKGENVVTCRLDLRDPQAQVGKKVPCPGCGTLFDVVSVEAAL